MNRLWKCAVHLTRFLCRFFWIYLSFRYYCYYYNFVWRFTFNAFGHLDLKSLQNLFKNWIKSLPNVNKWCRTTWTHNLQSHFGSRLTELTNWNLISMNYFPHFILTEIFAAQPLTNVNISLPFCCRTPFRDSIIIIIIIKQKCIVYFFWIESSISDSLPVVKFCLPWLGNRSF